jgi:hypothetical protein
VILFCISFSKSFLLLLFCQICVIVTIIFLEYFSLDNSCWIFCRIMYAGCRVRQRLVEDRAAIQAKIMDRSVIAERNDLRADLMVPPLDNILGIIKTYNWGYLHSCACQVYTRLVKLFYANLEVVRMMIVEWCFSPQSQAISSLLILKSLATSSESQYSRSRPTRTMRWCFLHPWMISGNSSVPFPMVRSALLRSGLVPCHPPTACWPRSFSRTSGLLPGAVILF